MIVVGCVPIMVFVAHVAASPAVYHLTVVRSFHLLRCLGLRGAARRRHTSMRSALRGLLNVLGPAVIEVVDDVRDVSDLLGFASCNIALLGRRVRMLPLVHRVVVLPFRRQVGLNVHLRGLVTSGLLLLLLELLLLIRVDHQITTTSGGAACTATIVVLVSGALMAILLRVLLLTEERVDQRLLLRARVLLVLVLLDLLELGLALSFRRSVMLLLLVVSVRGGLVLLHLLEEVLLAGALELHPLVRLNVVLLADVGHYAHGVAHCEGVVPDEAGDGLPHVIDLRHLYQQWNVVVQGPVVGVIVPGHDGQTALWLQHVGRGRVVDDYSIFHVPSDLGHILDEYSVDEGAVLTEQADRRVAFRVHHVHQRVRILR